MKREQVDRLCIVLLVAFGLTIAPYWLGVWNPFKFEKSNHYMLYIWLIGMADMLIVAVVVLIIWGIVGRIRQYIVDGD